MNLLGHRITPRGDSSAALERGKMLAIGALGSGIVHEFANLLTVVDGMRQMAEMGIATTWRPELVGKPAQRCNDLVAAFRAIFSSVDPDYVQSLPEVAEWLAVLLRARLRGHRTVVEIGDLPEVDLPERTMCRVRTGLLCLLLSSVTHGRRAGTEPERLVLSGRLSGGGRCVLTLFTEPWNLPDEPQPEITELLEAGFSILRGVGAYVDAEHEPGMYRLSIGLPVSAGSTPADTEAEAGS